MPMESTSSKDIACVVFFFYTLVGHSNGAPYFMSPQILALLAIRTGVFQWVVTHFQCAQSSMHLMGLLLNCSLRL